MMQPLLSAIVAAAILLPGCGTLQSDGPSLVRQSVKDLRDRNVVKQQEDYSCGAAALATLMTYYFGEETSETEVLTLLKNGLSEEDLRTKALRGFSLLDLKRAAGEKGYKAAGFRVKIEQLTKLVAPVLAYVQPMGYKHFTVLRGISHGRVFLADPARGNVRMSVAQFLDEWGVQGGVIFVLGKPHEQDIDEHELTLEEYEESPELVRLNAQLDLGMLSRKWTPDYTASNPFFVTTQLPEASGADAPTIIASDPGNGTSPLTQTTPNVALQNTAFNPSGAAQSPSSGQALLSTLTGAPITAPVTLAPAPSATAPLIPTTVTAPTVAPTIAAPPIVPAVTPSPIAPVAPVLAPVAQVAPVPIAPVPAASIPTTQSVTTIPLLPSAPAPIAPTVTAPTVTVPNLSAPIAPTSTTVTTIQPLASTTVSTTLLPTSEIVQPVVSSTMSTVQSTTQATTELLTSTTSSVSTLSQSTSVSLEPVVSSPRQPVQSSTPILHTETQAHVMDQGRTTSSLVDPIGSAVRPSASVPVPQHQPAPVSLPPLPIFRP